MVHAAQKRFVMAAVLHARAGQCHGGVRPAVEAAVEGNHERPSRGDLGQLDRGFHGLRAGVRQEQPGLLVELAGEVARQPLVELQAGLVVDDVLLAVDQLGRLLGDRGGDLGMGVAGIDDADTGRVVEVALAVVGDQPRAFAAFDDQVRIARPDGRHAVGQSRPIGHGVGQQVGDDRIPQHPRSVWTCVLSVNLDTGLTGRRPYLSGGRTILA